MSKKLVRWLVVMVCVLGIYGCSRKPENPPATQSATTKTAAEYKAEAEKQINEQNADEELKKLEQEVSAEANQP
jgi:predicted small lipoprotein YifL